MMKSIGTVQLALATIFVVPAVTGQDEGAHSLQSQLSATLNSLDYLANLRDRAAAGDEQAIGAIVATTEAPRKGEGVSGSYLESLQSDLARLRFQLDSILGDPAEVEAVMTLPGGVLRSLGLAGAPINLGREGRTSLSPRANSQGFSPLQGPQLSSANPFALSEGMNASMLQRIDAELLPLDSVTDSARRRGAEAVSLETSGYVAEPTHLGRLYVRSGRPAEAISLLEPAPASHARTYWLARAYQAQQRFEAAADLYRALLKDPAAVEFQAQAERDLKFAEFSLALRNTGASKR